LRPLTALNLLLSCLMAGVSASATEIPDLVSTPSSDSRVEKLMKAGSIHSLQLSSDSPLDGDAVSFSNTENYSQGSGDKITASADVTVSTTPGSIDSRNDNDTDQVYALTSGFTSTELALTEPGSFKKAFFWLFSLAGLVAIVAAASMIRYNRRNNEPLETSCRCSSCLSWKTLTSRWRWYELPLWLFTARPIRCFSCQRRQFAWWWSRQQVSGKPSQRLVPAR